MEKESITSTVWVMYSFLGKNKLVLVRLYWRVEAKIPHSTGLAISFACLAFVGSRNAKDGAKLRGVSQRKYDIHMGLAEDFKQMLRYIVSLSKWDQNLACIALDIQTVICVIHWY